MKAYVWFVARLGLTLAALTGCGWLLNEASTWENIAGAIGAGGVLWFWWTEVNSRGRRERLVAEMKRRGVLLVVAAVALGSAHCATRVNAGTVGIKINYAGTYRGVQDIPVVTGWVWYWPGSSTVLEYPVFVQNVVWTRSAAEGKPENEEITFTNADQMSIAVDISLAYHLDSTKVPAFYMKFRNDNLTAFTLGFMRNVARDQFNAVAGRYHMEQIMGDNGAFVAEVRKGLESDLGQYGVVIDQFGIIGSPRPPETVLQSITMKVQAQQIAIQKQNELAQATADAAKQIATSEGVAKAQIAQANGQAEANRIVNNSITSQLMEWERIKIQQKWNGVLPQVTGGAIPMIQLPQHAQ